MHFPHRFGTPQRACSFRVLGHCKSLHQRGPNSERAPESRIGGCKLTRAPQLNLRQRRGAPVRRLQVFRPYSSAMSISQPPQSLRPIPALADSPSVCAAWRYQRLLLSSGCQWTWLCLLAAASFAHTPCLTQKFLKGAGRLGRSSRSMLPGYDKDLQAPTGLNFRIKKSLKLKSFMAQLQHRKSFLFHRPESVFFPLHPLEGEGRVAELQNTEMAMDENFLFTH
eukprot:51626-Rhodomonas_salina.3